MNADCPGTTGADGAEARWVRIGSPAPHPLVALQTWTDECARYEALAAAVGDCEIVAVLPPRPGVDPLPRRVEQWVDHYEALLPALPVEPPYHLLGWSFGGVMALELARRLRESGTAVEFVGMIDTWRPRLLPSAPGEFLWYHLGVAASLPDGRARRAYLTRKAAFLFVRQAPRFGPFVRGVAIRLGYRKGRPVKHSVKPTDPLQTAVHTAYLNYRGTGVPLAVHLYPTAQSVARVGDSPSLGWAELLHAGFSLTPMPGDHFSVFEPEHVGALGAALRADLRR